MKKSLVYSQILLASFALTACGGGSSSDRAASPAPVQNGTYTSLQTVEDLDIEVSGKAFVVDNSTGTEKARRRLVTGVFNQLERTLSYSDGQIEANASKVEPMTIEADRILNNPALGTKTTKYTDVKDLGSEDSIVTIEVTTFDDSTYDYSVVFFASEDPFGSSEEAATIDLFSTGFIGIPTVREDVGNAVGNVRYKGDAAGRLLLDGTLLKFSSESTVDVNFGTNKADVFLRNIRTVNEENGNPVQKPITQIDVTGMRRTVEGFRDGTLSITDREGNILPKFNAVTPDFAEGGFFGYDPEKNVPDEVAGAIVADVDEDNGVSALFIAD